MRRDSLHRLLMTFWLLLAVLPLAAQTQPALVPVFFTGVVGGDAPGGRRVLLRWQALDGVVDLTNAVVYRTNAANTREKLAVVRATRDPGLIKSIFLQPGEQRIREDAEETLVRIYGTAGNTPDEFAARVIDLLEGRDKAEYAAARRNFLMQANYGFALVEGTAWLDFVNPAEGPFVYELWQGDGAGNAVDALGRITIDASVIAQLPAPANLREVFLKGRDGVTPARANHCRIYLNWDVPGDLKVRSDSTFGYNIYKLPRGLAPGEDFNSVQGEIYKVNKSPILEPSPIEGESADQTYIFADDGDWLETVDEDDLLTVGDTATYWAVARDLLGNEGLPSNPLEATVRDTFEPAVPRGISVFEDKDDARTPFLHVQWNVQTEDTASFRVYRYQEYGNTGKKGPFAPINGLTEGLVADLPVSQPAPATGKESYADFEVNQAPRSTGFWYCISAVDGHGNESSLSPAAYGVIEDVLGPGPGRITQFCITRPVLTASVAVASDPETRTTDWSPRFVLRREHPAILRCRIARLEIDPQRTQGSVTAIELGVVEFNGTDVREFSYTDPLIISTIGIPVYRFTFEDTTGQTVETEATPPAGWTIGSERVVYRATVRIDRYQQVCDPFGGPGVLKPGPLVLVPGGSQAPFEITLGCDGDAVAHRLYRSVDGCKTYALVREVSCEELASVSLTDDFHPGTLTEVCYSLVSVDKHGNLGPPRYLDPTFVYAGDVAAPTLVSAQATGLPTNPSLTIKWIGPKSGVLYYRLHFINVQDGPHKPLEYPVNELDYDPATNEFLVVTSVIDRDGNLIDPSKDYEVQVEAVALSKTARASDKLPFSWKSKAFNQGPAGTLRWAARPLPPVVELSTTIYFSHPDKGMLIQIKEMGGQEAGIQKFTIPEFPFIVWRQRVDKTGQPWVAVSPLIEQVNYTGEFLDDGFFLKIPYPLETDPERLFFIDNSGHIQGATYRYLFMELHPVSGEIVRLRGPVAFTIIIPG